MGEDRAVYANVIVDISVEKLDKTFQYLVPGELKGDVAIGVQVKIPFGNRAVTGYVIELTGEPEIDVERIKPILEVCHGAVAIESQLIALAGWMRKNYGSTMNQALKTVLPVRRKTRQKQEKSVSLCISKEQAKAKLALYESRRNTAKARLVRELIAEGTLDYSLVVGRLNVSSQTVRALSEQGVVRVTEKRSYRNPVGKLKSKAYRLTLNENQRRVVAAVVSDMERGIFSTYLVKGVTGSGKTEVYMELIAHVIERGRQAIVLIPEIALTYQTVMRFYGRFGDRVSIMNSRLSGGERYDQFERAKAGDIDIMIGPRSALFTPFAALGLIIIDEEHETSYKSETAPRYHARDVALERARMCGASLVLGSATPSVDSYYRAKCGSYRLLELSERVDSRPLPACEIVDMRKELMEGNRSILSVRLQELMEERLARGEQIMLFLNRRGAAGFISCRACGGVIKCPHCDVSLSLHMEEVGGHSMVCHYCGYRAAQPTLCPACGSRYLGGFKAGTQRIEQLVQKRFPTARTMRMDFDSTRTKDSYEKILSAFASREADILVGTQMIVKGHDFPNVTLVGVLAADMSLHVSDFHASERTFQLLTQAVGRAGRGKLPGAAVIQTYAPDNFAVEAARDQDYDRFYGKEIAYRSMLSYPPVWNLLLIHCTGTKQPAVELAAGHAAVWLKGRIAQESETVLLVGPADAAVAKVNDVYRKVIYMKAKRYDTLVRLKDETEHYVREQSLFSPVTIQFDFNPVSGF